MLTSQERIARILKRQPVDRIGLFEVFWTETAENWARKGYFAQPEDVEDHFRLDLRRCRAFDLVANIHQPEQIIEETETTRLVRDGNGALLRQLKHKSGAPEHVGFIVRDRQTWNTQARDYLLARGNYPARIRFDLYRSMRDKCRRENIFLCCAADSVFELMQKLCGHEYLLMGMALEPEWVRDMCRVYSDVTIDLMEALFAQEGLPDGIWFWEDMGFKGKTFMSPSMYQELLLPAHKKLFRWAHAKNLPVIVHSCGFVEPLVPFLIEAGMDCLQPMEVKAGMDVVKLKKQFGEVISFIGGIDVRLLIENNLGAIRNELEQKLPVVMANSGYVLQVDHSVPDQVEYSTYKYFVETGLKLGLYAGFCPGL